MACVSSIQYTVIINGYPTNFFGVGRGLFQGCSLSPLLFIVNMDGLSHKIKVVCLEDIFHRHMVGHYIRVSHNLFVDNILLFSMLSKTKWGTLQHVFYWFRSALGLITNTDNTLLLFAEGKHEDIRYIVTLFGVETQPICFGLKYSGFNIKPNDYKVNDSMWITNIFHKKITMWERQCLTLCGKVTLTQLVLQQFAVYWAYLFCLPTMIIRKINGIMEKFI